MHTQPRLELDWDDVFREASGAGQFATMELAKSYGAKNVSLAFAEAVRRGRRDVMDYLKWAPDSLSIEGAARGNQVEIGQAMLPFVADVKWKKVLRAACRSGCAYFVKLALQHVAHDAKSIQAIFRGGHRHLFDPVMQNQVIQFSSEPDWESYLLAACRGNHAHFIDFAIFHGAPQRGTTRAALLGGHVELAKYLFASDGMQHLAFAGASESWDALCWLIGHYKNKHYGSQHAFYLAILNATCSGQTTFAKSLWPFVSFDDENTAEWLVWQACKHNNQVLAEFYLGYLDDEICNAINGAATGGHAFLTRAYVHRYNFHVAPRMAWWFALIAGHLDIAEEWWPAVDVLDLDVAQVIECVHGHDRKHLRKILEWCEKKGCLIPWNTVLDVSTLSFKLFKTLGAWALEHGGKLSAMSERNRRDPKIILHLLQCGILSPSPTLLRHVLDGPLSLMNDYVVAVIEHLLSMGLSMPFTYDGHHETLVHALVENGLPIKALSRMTGYKKLCEFFEARRPDVSTVQTWLPVSAVANLVVSYFP